jgi:hypothetical protein
MKSFEFSYCLDEIEEIIHLTDMYQETNESEYILTTLIKNNKISIGERTKGTISWDDSVQPIVYHLDYEYCSQVGVDWYDDVWEEVQEQVQL